MAPCSNCHVMDFISIRRHVDEQINKITEIAVRRTIQMLICRPSLQPLDIVGLESQLEPLAPHLEDNF